MAGAGAGARERAEEGVTGWTIRHAAQAGANTVAAAGGKVVGRTICRLAQEGAATEVSTAGAEASVTRTMPTRHPPERKLGVDPRGERRRRRR